MKILKNNDNVDIVFNGLMDFINNYKNDFPTKRQIKMNINLTDGVFVFSNTFNDEWGNFINYFLNDLKLNKYDENIKIHFVGDGMFTDYINIYTKTKKYKFDDMF